MTLDPGTIIKNRYRIQKIIASGGMGSIYQALDESLGVEIALKENLYSSDEHTRQFKREATLLANMRHPNLPRVTDHFEIENQGQYLVMDFIEGEDLRQRIDRGGILQETDAIIIGAAICEALKFLHTQQPVVLHRDIKPGNIKINSSGHIFLVDFGLAKISQTGQVTTTGAQAFTPGYAPPEQYGQGTDTRSDIYSLGAALYAAITGKIPEDAMSRAIGSVNLTLPHFNNPTLSPAIENVLLKALEIDPNKRFQSALEFQNALLASLPKPLQARFHDGNYYLNPTSNSHSSSPSNATVVARSNTQPVSKNRSLKWLIPVLITLIIISIIGIVFSIFRSKPVQSLVPTTLPVQSSSNPIEEIAPTIFVQIPTKTNEPVATPQPLAVATNLPTAQPAIKPTIIGGGDGQFAYVSDQTNIPQIWIGSANNNELYQLTDLPDGACQPNWSPDGQHLVFISPCLSKKEIYRGAGLFIISLVEKSVSPLPSLPGGDFEPAWSPDGTTIAFTSLRDGSPKIYLLDIETGETTRLSNPANIDRQTAWSPDGKQIAFTTTRLGKSQIWIMDSAGKSPREFSSLTGGSAIMPAWSPDGRVIVYAQTSSLILAARQVGNKFSIEEPISPKLNLTSNPSYSPDGHWIIFESWMDGNHNIYRITRSGTNLTPLTNLTGLEFQPVWRPASLH